MFVFCKYCIFFFICYFIITCNVPEHLLGSFKCIECFNVTALFLSIKEFWTSALLLIVWNVLWFGFSIYDYNQINKAGNDIKSLNRQIQAMDKVMHELLHRLQDQEKTIFRQRCLICLLIAALAITCTMLYQCGLREISKNVTSYE